MTTVKDSLGAWRVSPAEYLRSRVETFSVGEPSSTYVTMRDGCRLAVDVYVPVRTGAGEAVSTFPTLAFFTPYYRRFELRAGATGEANPNTGKFRDFFVPRGYAAVVVDVRGTGASFGTRDSFRSPSERDDSREVADWIVAQPWSNGTIGSTGISYLGAAADFLAATGHPSVKAIAPLFSVWDTYADNYFPGGIQIKSLTAIYDELMVGLDHDRRDILASFSYFANPDFEGPRPVDEDTDGSLLKAAVTEHLGNFRQTDFMSEFRFREEGLPYDPGFTSASFSPYATSPKVDPGVAVMSVSGWRDGAGYMNGAISRYLTLEDNPRHLLLGPWDHGARIDVSPWRTSVEPDFPLLGELLRFFDTYLHGLETGLRDEAPIHYYSLHAEAWRSADAWPPTETSETFYLAGDGRLDGAPQPGGSDEHKVDFMLGTGGKTRYERIAGIDCREYYPDWPGRTERMLAYTSGALKHDSELVGHAVVELWFASSERDAAIFVYLSELEGDGTERYVTEGLLRALHRKEAAAPDTYRTTWPFRTFTRRDAAPLEPGRPEHVRIPLLPVAWRFSAGSRIRMSIAGADADHCGQVPHGRPPRLTVLHGGDKASALHVPILTVDRIRPV